MRECQADPAEHVDTRAVAPDATRFAAGRHVADLRVGRQRTGTEVPVEIRY